MPIIWPCIFFGGQYSCVGGINQHFTSFFLSFFVSFFFFFLSFFLYSSFVDVISQQHIWLRMSVHCTMYSVPMGNTLNPTRTYIENNEWPTIARVNGFIRRKLFLFSAHRKRIREKDYRQIRHARRRWRNGIATEKIGIEFRFMDTGDACRGSPTQMRTHGRARTHTHTRA